MMSLEALAEALPQIRPLDEHNEALVRNVHPPEWVNPEPAKRYNIVVIGGGTAGLVTAAGAAGVGAKVALVERALMGGDCLNVGCVPSKALIRCARAFAEVRAAGAFGVRVPDGVKVDFPAVMERMRRLRAGISRNDSAQRFRDLGIDVFIGDARFTATDTVEVDGKVLRFARACIATGARAAALPIRGLAEAGYLTNETVFSLTELPPRVAVIGAGPIGCEMAQIFARFGSHVTLLEATRQILPREDRDAAERIENALVRDGVVVNCCCKIVGVRQDGHEKVIELEGEGDCPDLTVDEILLAVGRAPNLEGLDLQAAGVEYDKTGVKVSDRLQTTNKRVYAAGDICSPYKFTHTADALARIVIQNALFFGRARASGLIIPWCTYTDPEIAHVGMHAHEAQEKGNPEGTVPIALSEVDRAILDAEDNGFVRVYAGRKGIILVATIVASHAGDAISEISLAMTHGLGLGSIAKTIHPYPTRAEAIRKVGDAYNRTRLTPFVKRLFAKWLSWTR